MAAIPCRLSMVPTGIVDDEGDIAVPASEPQPLSSVSWIPSGTKDAWFVALLQQSAADPNTTLADPSLDFMLSLDGTVEKRPHTCVAAGTLPASYPLGYQIPAALSKGIDTPSKVLRAREFALAGLIYEAYHARAPFATSEIQSTRRVLGATSVPSDYFPADVQELPGSAMMAVLSLWSPAFACSIEEYAKEDAKPLNRLKKYAGQHPYSLGMQAASLGLCVTGMAAPAALAAYGFGALGPTAASWAAGWQAGMGGVVQAGSTFAWCQSAAMGGAAAASFTTMVTTMGVAGTAGFAAASVGAMLSGTGEKELWFRRFQEAVGRDLQGGDCKQGSQMARL